jgi:hypothetical protein
MRPYVQTSVPHPTPPKKSKGILIHGAIWIKLKDMLAEISQSLEDKYWAGHSWLMPVILVT